MKLRVQILKTLNIALIHFQPMFCFPTPENIRKPLFFYVFRVYRSGALVENGLNSTKWYLIQKNLNTCALIRDEHHMVTLNRMVLILRTYKKRSSWVQKQIILQTLLAVQNVQISRTKVKCTMQNIYDY